MEQRGVLIDFDDTLVETTVYFDWAREKFALKMKELGYPRDEAMEMVNRFDIENVREYGGFLKECFPHAMSRTYKYFCRQTGQAHSEDMCRMLEEIGWWVYRQEPELLPGAREALEELSGEYQLYLVTRADPTVQVKRIAQSGLTEYFDEIFILNKKTEAEYRHIIQKHGLDNDGSWMVGNSMKSDINPGLKAGLKCIHVHHPHTWHFEEEAPLGGHISVSSIREVPVVIKKAAKK